MDFLEEDPQQILVKKRKNKLLKMKAFVMLLKGNLVKQKEDLTSIESWQNFPQLLKQPFLSLFWLSIFLPCFGRFCAFFSAFFEKEQIFSCFLPFAINKSYIFSELSQQKLIFSTGLNNQLSFSCCPLTFSASPKYVYSSL